MTLVPLLSITTESQLCKALQTAEDLPVLVFSSPHTPLQSFIWIQSTQKGKSIKLQARFVCGNTRIWLLRCNKYNQDTLALQNQGPAKQCQQLVHITAPKYAEQFPWLLN